MKENEILESNKLIVKFIGAKLFKRCSKYELWIPLHGAYKIDTIEVEKGETLKFHKSWDWLMPVVEKIEGLNYYVKISQNICTIGSADIRAVSHKPLIRETGNYEEEDTKISNTYKAVVEFIKVS